MNVSEAWTKSPLVIGFKLHGKLHCYGVKGTTANEIREDSTGKVLPASR